MWSNEDVLNIAMTALGGKHSDICVIDFFRLCSNVPLEMRKKHGDFRDELVRRFPIRRPEFPKTKSRRCRWTVEIFSSDIIDQVIDFNHNLKSMPESHHLIFLCLDDRIQPDEEIRLKCSYFDSQFFQFDQKSNPEEIFDCLKRKKLKKLPRNQLINFYPLLLHADSDSTGLAFNYYYSYLTKQIGSTNNLFLTFHFNKHISRELFPLTISVKLKTLIEKSFLTDCPSTMNWNDQQEIESKVLIFNFDSTKSRSINENEINVTYSLIGTKDFGLIIQQIRIWQQLPSLDHLVSVGLKDDIRQWNEQFIFENQEDRTRRCSFHPISHVPTRSGGHQGVSTMKKTSKDSYDLYRSDHRNAFTKNGQRIIKVLMIPVYYILMPSSCQFGPSDLNECCESDPIILQGTIIDPNIPDRIQLAYANNEVLRSPPMKELNRYLRRTFYSVDQINANNEVIRYLFCGEYPFILSTLDQMEQRGEISSIEKHEEYLRFCNILHRLIQSNNLSQSIKLIEYNDLDGNFDADLKPPWNQIKEDIDQWYSNQINHHSIESKILPFLNETPHLLLFFTDQAKSNPLILTLINDIKEKVQLNGFVLEDAQGNVDLIESAQQVLLICTGRRNDPINSSIIKSIETKMNKFGVFRDVFVLINDAIRYFPCRFVRSIPYLTFDLAKRSASLNPNEIDELIFYLKNMNILSKSSQLNFEDINSILRKSPLQCTSVGGGCATAFYFNYLKLLISSAAHYCRIKLLKNEIERVDSKGKFLSKWIFLIPSIIENLNKIIPSALSIDENEQKMIGFQLAIWKSTNEKFVVPDLTITIGGIYQRSYSSLTIYQLTNLTSGECVYFPMEIPGALYALESQYQNVLSHFNFGKYDPFKQGLIFQTKVQSYFSHEIDQTVCENIHLIYFDNSQRSKTNLQSIEIFLQFLWNELCLFI